jgi:vancomycin aglycone glucosyltransferase
VPQVVIPQHYDQHYWAQRVHQLGIGIEHVGRTPTTESLTSALERMLDYDVVARAKSVAPSVSYDGAHLAAQQLICADKAAAHD